MASLIMMFAISGYLAGCIVAHVFGFGPAFVAGVIGSVPTLCLTVWQYWPRIGHR